MKENKKSLIVIIIILIIIILGLGGYIVYDKLNNKTNNIVKENNNIIGDILPLNINDYNFIYWDYKYLYNYYFNMEDDKNNFENLYKFVKVDNNKLYWNIDNIWVQDNKIKEDITYFYSGSTSEPFIIFTSSNELYALNIPEAFYENTEYFQEQVISKDIYDGFIYNAIDINGNISKIAIKTYTECESFSKTYIEIDNKIYIIDDEYKLIELNKYMDNYKYINELINNCHKIYGNIINVNFDGSLYQVKNNKGNNILIKYYFQVYNDTELYDLIIDSNNNLYIINRNKEDIDKINELTPKTKINNINIIQTAEEIKIEITLSGGETIKLSN